MHRLQGCWAKTTLRYVKDALESEVIVLAVDDTQIGDGIPGFLAFIKARSPDHPIRHTDRDQAFFKFPHLKSGTHQDCHFFKAVTFALARFNLVADHPGFFFVVPNGPNFYRISGFHAGPERFAQASFVMRDETGCSGENMRRRAIVLL